MSAELGDWDPFEHCPLTGQINASSAKLTPLEGQIFEIDDRWNMYRQAKLTGREERKEKYYQKRSPEGNIQPILQYIIDKLTTEYPDDFQLNEANDKLYLKCQKSQETLIMEKDLSLIKVYDPKMPKIKVPYVDTFDALSMQVPEDMVIHKYDFDTDEDYTTHVHLFHPNGWSAEGAIGQSFGAIHDHVKNADGKHVIRTPSKMVKHLVSMTEPIQRLAAISFRTDTYLNRHPDVPDALRHKPFNRQTNANLFMRFERQTVTGFPELGCFLFTIKTYFVDCDNKDVVKRDKIIKSFENVSPDAYARPFLNEHREEVLKWLKDECAK